MRRIRGDHEWQELRGASVFRARNDLQCDMHRCPVGHIKQGQSYARLSTQQRVCNQHWEPADIVEVAK